MPYRLWVPADYNPGTSYPPLLYLPHAGLIGTDKCIRLTEEIGSGGYGKASLIRRSRMEKPSSRGSGAK